MQAGNIFNCESNVIQASILVPSPPLSEQPTPAAKPNTLSSVLVADVLSASSPCVFPGLGAVTGTSTCPHPHVQQPLSKSRPDALAVQDHIPVRLLSWPVRTSGRYRDGVPGNCEFGTAKTRSRPIMRGVQLDQ